MVSLIVHAILGIAVIALIVASNRPIFARTATGPALSLLEIVYYAVGIASIALGWYFNIRYVAEYHVSNPVTGWIDYIRLMFVNPAAGSASQDYTIGNVILLPLMTIIDGYRRGIRRPWLYFVSSLFTSFAFAWAFYLVTVERQRRHEKALAVAA
ncbi:DUF2834 domain-containing protein [Mycobacteroides chelonae]